MNANQTVSRMAPASMVADESVLIDALRQGEEWAFEAMVRTYGGRLYAVARRICANDEDARDALQAAYLNAFKSLAGFEGACQLSTC